MFAFFTVPDLPLLIKKKITAYNRICYMGSYHGDKNEYSIIMSWILLIFIPY